jgi:hypothetical protein
MEGIYMAMADVFDDELMMVPVTALAVFEKVAPVKGLDRWVPLETFDVVARAKAIQIADPATRFEAEQEYAAIGKLIKLVRSGFKEEKAHWNQKHKEACAKENRYLKPLQAAEVIYGDKLRSDRALQEQAAREEQATRQAEADAEAEADRIAVALASGAAPEFDPDAELICPPDVFSAALAEAAALLPPAAPVVPLVLETSTLQWNTGYTAHVVDMHAFCRAIADGVLPVDAALGLERDDKDHIGSTWLRTKATEERERLSMPGVVLDEIKTPVRR